MRKIATMLVALGLTFGLLGAGISATFSDSVTATQNMQVGDFECKITDATPKAASDGISADGKSITYSAPDILSGAPGSAPFSFTVKATGDIPVLLRVTHNATAPFGSLGDPIAPVVKDAGGSKTYNVGLTWGDLAGYEGASLSITYTVACDEVDHLVPQGPASVTEGPSGTYTIVSAIGPCAPYADTCPLWGSVVFTSKTSGMAIGNVDYSFLSSGLSSGGAPRLTVPISFDGDASIESYASIDVNACGGATAPPSTTVSTTLATCVVSLNDGSLLLGPWANWDAMVAAHPTWTVAAGHLPFVQVDGGLGTYVVSNLTETVN